MSAGEGPWLDQAPWGMSPALAARMEGIAREVAAAWGLALGPRILAGRYSYVASAGDDAILKVIPPEDDESEQTAEALALWGGRGAVRLLRHDPSRRALLIERARPGGDLSALPREEAIRIALGVARDLWRRPERAAPFRWVGDEIPRWLRNAGEHPLLDIARARFAAMRVERDTLIHGDYHQHNVLRDGERWIAIDPKPMLGEPEFDVPTLLWNPIGFAPTRASVEADLRTISDAGVDAERVLAWAVIRGAYLGLPLEGGETEETVRQLRVVRALL